MDDSRYYTPSGTAPVGGIFSAASISGTAALLAGAVYGIVDHYNPLIYVNFLGTLFLAAVVGIITNGRLTSGRIRSRFASVLIALFAATMMLYGSWVTYVLAISQWKGLILDPLTLLQLIEAFAAMGLWSIKKHTPTGWELYICWLIEAGVMYFFVLSSALEAQPPYCEDCDERTKEDIAKYHFASRPAPLLRDELESEHYEPFLEVLSTEPNPRIFMTVSMNSCPSCSEANFLRISEVAVTTNKEGKDETKEAVVIPWIRVDSRNKERIVSAIKGGYQSTRPTEDAAEELNDFINEEEAS